MIEIKTSREIQLLKALAKDVESILFLAGESLSNFATTYDIQKFVMTEFKKKKISSAFHGYSGYPEYICVSLNDEVVHGIPRKNRYLKKGDLIKIDIGGLRDGFIADVAFTFGGNQETKKLIEIAVEALNAGGFEAKPGRFVGDISRAVEDVAKKYKLGVIKNFVGHGIGRKLHEEPQIPNYYISDGCRLEKNMILCIEPMFSTGSGDTVIDVDGWTARTADGSFAVHVEGMVVVDNPPQILTPIIFNYGKNSS